MLEFSKVEYFHNILPFAFLEKLSNLTRDKKLSKDEWIMYLNKIEAQKKYEFVVGVPHKKYMPIAEKMDALIKVYKQTGMIPMMANGGVPGSRKSLPMWKAKVERLLPEEIKEKVEVHDFENYSPSVIYEIEVPRP